MPPKKKPSLLIVDPDTHLADLLAKRFSADGWTVRMAKSVDQAETLLKRKHSDVVLVDPAQKLEPEEVLVKLVDQAASGARTLILHTGHLTRKTLDVWKRLEGSAILRKGEYSLSEFVKRVRKVGSKKDVR